ncbi:MAG: type IX secretion system protein PorQ [Schleiferiaceae bacterium]|nr:type IX secretion system protein PorQ [Schleiferiaceae bacterium]
MIRPLAILLLCSFSAIAQSGSAGVFTFLDRNIFAGSSALGNTSYIHPGPTGAYAVQNPLLLSDSSIHQLDISIGSLGNGVRLLQGSYGFKLKGKPVIASVQSVQYGEFIATDPWGMVLGEFSAGDLAINIGSQLGSFKRFSFAASGKLINGTYESYQSWAVASDWVAMYSLAAGPDMALIVKNVGVQLTAFGNKREPLPTNLLFAFGDKLKYAPFRWTFVVDQLSKWNLGYQDPNLVNIDPVTGEQTQETFSMLNLGLRHLSGSIEFLPTQRLHLMVGYNFRRQFEMSIPTRRTSGGFSLGAGLFFNSFQLHYANELRSLAGRMNTLSLSLNI